MPLFEKAVIKFDNAKTICQEDGLARVSRTRVMVVQCASDTFALIVCELVQECLSARPPNVIVCSPIVDDILFDFSESSKLTVGIFHENVYHYIKFQEDTAFWAFTGVVAGAKGLLATRRVEIQDMLETVLDTIPMVENPHAVPPEYVVADAATGSNE
ncbi:hypothetical protein L226DRAFT_576947 [Lentinus tigrinus ALCF2SS1-7]|nr:hypothetical protein L226DRAFT_576971 [Lentinus tigrinus ALCF2SS1-7]RPD67797.1 hypothetical protein L226DRAFT_576947 [Lentinus tigrinus ALCF2SS1-7]